MKKIMSGLLASLFLLANAGVAASAADYIPPFDGQHQIIAKGVDDYSGGVGVTEREQMEAMTKGYNLKLVFDTKSGEYLSSVAVRVQNAQGKVLIDTISQGPWFSAKLPAGNYRVTATFDQHSQTRHVTLTQKPETLILSMIV
jgi:hypothetical protein